MTFHQCISPRPASFDPVFLRHRHTIRQTHTETHIHPCRHNTNKTKNDAVTRSPDQPTCHKNQPTSPTSFANPPVPLLTSAPQRPMENQSRAMTTLLQDADSFLSTANHCNSEASSLRSCSKQRDCFRFPFRPRSEAGIGAFSAADAIMFGCRLRSAPILTVDVASEATSTNTTCALPSFSMLYFSDCFKFVLVERRVASGKLCSVASSTVCVTFCGHTKAISREMSSCIDPDQVQAEDVSNRVRAASAVEDQ